MDCALSEWDEWSYCSKAVPSDQLFDGAGHTWIQPYSAEKHLGRGLEALRRPMMPCMKAVLVYLTMASTWITVVGAERGRALWHTLSRSTFGARGRKPFRPVSAGVWQEIEPCESWKEDMSLMDCE